VCEERPAKIPHQESTRKVPFSVVQHESHSLAFTPSSLNGLPGTTFAVTTIVDHRLRPSLLVIVVFYRISYLLTLRQVNLTVRLRQAWMVKYDFIMRSSDVCNAGKQTTLPLKQIRHPLSPPEARGICNYKKTIATGIALPFLI
jgi:hypothetical protein